MSDKKKRLRGRLKGLYDVYRVTRTVMINRHLLVIFDGQIRE